MKKTHVFAGALCLLILTTLSLQAVSLGKINGVVYRTGKWNKKWGDQRILIEVKQPNQKAVRARIEWRKESKDTHPYEIQILDSKQHIIQNRTVLSRSSSMLDLLFEPTTGAGIYTLYYWIPDPERTKGFGPKSFPQTYYKMYTETANKMWLSSAKKHPLESAKVIAFESLERPGPEKLRGFNSFYPMEVALTPKELQTLKNSNQGQPFVLFPEDRNHSIRMTDDLPFRWLKKPATTFVVDAAKGQYATYQIGVWALSNISDLHVHFSDLKGAGGVIPKDKMTCFNLGGIDWEGHSFTKKLSVKKGKIQPLWCGIDLPQNLPQGTYEGHVEVSANNATLKQSFQLRLQISAKTIPNRGDNDPWNFSHLRWLNSTIGLDDKPVAPYIPIEKKSENTFTILGRKITLSPQGLPAQATSYISMEEIKKQGRDILARPITFQVETTTGIKHFKMQPLTFLKETAGKIVFQTTGQAEPNLLLTCKGTLESDGYMRYALTLQSKKTIHLKDVALIIPFKKEVAKYAMGKFGTSGKMPPDRSVPIEGGLMYNVVWGGDYNAGIGCWLKNQNDEWNADNASKMDEPTLKAWTSGKNGTYRLTRNRNAIQYEIHTGARPLNPSDPLRLDFALMITPFKPLTSFRWAKIYHPRYGTMPDKRGASATFIDLHHASKFNPYINYPFIANQALKTKIDAYHAEGKKVRIYYTIRELSILAVELWMMRSLGDEIFVQDGGYLGSLKIPHKQIKNFGKNRFVRSGYSWLCEHLIDNYRVRWHCRIRNEIDASIAMQGLSRWHNYYLEGLKWLIQNVGIDGLYLDGIGYDREIMKRVRKTMVEAGNPCTIDFHGAVHFAWLTHAPFVDSLWYGEGAKYHAGPDYWLIEVSGIPFGLSGGILSGDKNKKADPIRGMIFGCARRIGWSGSYNSTHLWKLWDRFKIAESKHLGYWDPACPIHPSNPKIKASLFLKKTEALLVLASWSNKEENTTLKIDWNALGFNPATIKVALPEIEKIQKGRPQINLKTTLKIPANKGLIIWIKNK